MLKTNNKKVIEKVKKYIIENFDFENSNIEESEKSFELVSDYILKVCFDCQLSNIHHDKLTMLQYFYNFSFYKCFSDWVYGLPSLFDLGYCYLSSAKDLIADWLEESESEKEKYSEDEAELLATKLIFRELTKKKDLYKYLDK